MSRSYKKAYKTRRETLLDNKRMLDFMALASDKPQEEFHTRIPDPPKPREKSQHTPERIVLSRVMLALRAHPLVAACWRMQSGVFQAEDRTVRVGTVGMSDILGMLVGGRLFAIECKAERGTVTPAQREFLDAIRQAGGIAGVAYSEHQAIDIIDAATLGD